jgi:RNA-binding protein
MLTSKQRAALRGLANSLQSVTQVGKSGVTDEVCESIEVALDSKELIKLTVLETAPLTAREAADEVSERLGADVVSVIGRKFVLFRVSTKEENRKISAELKLK